MCPGDFLEPPVWALTRFKGSAVGAPIASLIHGRVMVGLYVPAAPSMKMSTAPREDPKNGSTLGLYNLHHGSVDPLTTKPMGFNKESIPKRDFGSIKSSEAYSRSSRSLGGPG